MKRPYEIPVVFRVISSDEEFQQAIDQVVAWIENSNEFEEPGKVTKIDRTRFGRRRLAYEIDGQRDGFYVFFYADVEPAHLTEFELNMKLYDPVLRFLVIREEPPKKKKKDDSADSAENEETENDE